ncbi:MAG: hypothetical protein ACRDE2_16410, partial [Chitinophagaceae bacterium]
AGFHVVNHYGNRVDFKGAIINQPSDTILTFQPYKFGMGHFYFTPNKNENYKAIIRIKDGPTLFASFPEIEENGSVMHVQDVGENQVQINVHNNISDESFCYLIIHTRESVKTAEVLFFKNGQATFTINKNKLGEGISQMTVFNEALQPVCERLYFKQPYKKLTIHAATNQPLYSLRNKVMLHLQTNDENEKPLKADLSVSVYKLDSLQTTDNDNILSYLWLTSELKGRIECPEYYFQNNNDSVHQALDNLMLTQGWRRFKWNEMMQNKMPVIQYAPELSGPVISGKVINSQNGMPVAGVVSYLSILGRSAKVQGYLSDSNGLFHFNMKNFYGPHEMVAETNTQSKDSIYNVEISNPFSDEFSNYPYPNFQITSALAGQLYD